MGGFSHLIETAGIPTLFLSIFGEAFGLPLPGESIMIAIVALSDTGNLSLRDIVIAAWSASVLGNATGYFLGRRFGTAAVLAHGARIGLTKARFAKTEEKMARYGVFILVASRFVLVLRQVSGFVAGTTEMPWLRYMIANLVGATLWVFVWVWIGLRFGDAVALLPWFWENLGIVTIITAPVLALGAIILWWALRRHKAHKASSPE